MAFPAAAFSPSYATFPPVSSHVVLRCCTNLQGDEKQATGQLQAPARLSPTLEYQDRGAMFCIQRMPSRGERICAGERVSIQMRTRPKEEDGHPMLLCYCSTGSREIFVIHPSPFVRSNQTGKQARGTLFPKAFRVLSCRQIQ